MGATTKSGNALMTDTRARAADPPAEDTLRARRRFGACCLDSRLGTRTIKLVTLGAGANPTQCRARSLTVPTAPTVQRLPAEDRAAATA